MSVPEVVYQVRWTMPVVWSRWVLCDEEEYLAALHNPKPGVEVRTLYALDAAPLATNDELLALLPGTHYMDPPDGGNVSVLEQLQRMAEDARRLREHVAKLQTERAQLVTRINNWRHEPRVYGDLRCQLIRIDEELKELGR